MLSTKPSSVNTRSEALAVLHDPTGSRPAPSDLLLVPFCFWLPHHPGRAVVLAGSHADLAPHPTDLRAAIAAHLNSCGWPNCEALRWAITAVDPNRGLQLEGVAIGNAMQASPGP